MGVIPNPKMAFIFPILCILALIFPIFIKYFPKCVGKGSFPKSRIKSLQRKMILRVCCSYVESKNEVRKHSKGNIWILGDFKLPKPIDNIPTLKSDRMCKPSGDKVFKYCTCPA